MHMNNPLARLMALTLLNAMLAAPKKQAAEPEQPPASAAQANADPLAFLDQLMAHAATTPRPAANAIPHMCVIPEDIAERCGMNADGFDPHTLEGRTVALLASAMATLRELRERCDPAGAAKVQMADQNIGAAVAALGLL